MNTMLYGHPNYSAKEAEQTIFTDDERPGYAAQKLKFPDGSMYIAEIFPNLEGIIHATHHFILVDDSTVMLDLDRPNSKFEEFI